MTSLIILIIVFVLIAIRQVGNVKLKIWQIMAGGAAAVLLTGQISIGDAINAVDTDVILFLFGMFIVGEALERSGYLSNLSYRFFRNAKSINSLLLFIIFGAGLMAALLMNDTLAIIGTPVILLLAEKHSIPPKVLMFTLAFAVTVGSVMSPIGNPQNLLIAVNGNISNPFETFLKFLLVPTFLCFFSTFFVIKFFFKKEIAGVKELTYAEEDVKDPALAKLSKISLILILVLVAIKIIAVFYGDKLNLKLTYIALISAAPIILFSPGRKEILKKVDWFTLIFFAAMFILMRSVWNGGIFQELIKNSNVDISTIPLVILISVLLSQLISNVPLVALYLPLLVHLGVHGKGLMALAAGSTIAGNMLILGAASNVIIIQTAESRGKETLGFIEFAKIGIPLTIINAGIYYLFLYLF
jgi:Na+/H+ antiporter NhaD/arsenite permease-like protein